MTTEIPYDEGMRAQPGMGWPPDPDPVGSAPRPVPGLDQIPGVEQVGALPGAGDPAHHVHGQPGSAADAAEQPGPASLDDELATLLPRPDLITLVDGTRCTVKKLKTRELLSLMGIAIGGVGPKMFDLKLNPEDSPGAFVAKFAGLIISAFPYAQDETMAFLRQCVDPAGLVTEGRTDKAVKARNDALTKHLDALLANPEPDDTITIIEALARKNAGDVQTWGKRLAGIWKLAKATGQIPASLQSPG